MHYPSLKRVITENSKDNLTQGDDKNFFMSKIASIKLLLTKQSENTAQKFQQPSSTLPKKYKLFTIHQSSTHLFPPCKLNCLLFLKFYILNFWFILYTVHSPQNILIPSSAFKNFTHDSSGSSQKPPPS